MKEKECKKVTIEIKLYVSDTEEVIPTIMEVLERNIGLLPSSGSVFSGLGDSPKGGSMNIKVEVVE